MSWGISMRVLFVSSILLCSGCIFSSDPPPGTLEVRWTIGAGVQTCEEAGLDLVEITLEEEGGDLFGPFAASCESGRSGTYSLDDLEEGTYTIVIDALAGEERVYTGTSQDTYTVESDTTVRTERVVLSPIPASLDVLWRFEDGRQCGFHDVDELVIRAFLNNAVAEEVTTTCAEGEALIEDVLPASTTSRSRPWTRSPWTPPTGSRRPTSPWQRAMRRWWTGCSSPARTSTAAACRRDGARNAPSCGMRDLAAA
jgi:hypothetical protein